MLVERPVQHVASWSVVTHVGYTVSVIVAFPFGFIVNDTASDLFGGSPNKLWRERR